VKKLEEGFGASAHSVKFSQQDRVSEEINKWISQKTHGRIKKGVTPDDFKSRSEPGIVDEPALVTVNAVYFKADWGSRFDRRATRERRFHLDSARVEDVPMMHQRSLLRYSENDRFKFLEIPYVDGHYSMYLLLPKEVLTAQKMMALLSTELIVRLKSTASAHDVDVLLPKFEIGSHHSVRNALAAMGVKAAFDNQRADFDRMIVKRLEAFRIYISEVYHDAWIALDEEGTEAAAATTTVHYSFGCSASQAPPPAEFHADHPFVFLIVHNQSRSILFAGWISNPVRPTPKAPPTDG
jgi:serpin B